jgi:hypothetical protein
MKIQLTEIPEDLSNLDWCQFHGYENCTCPAWIVTMGCQDIAMERLLTQVE